MVFVNFTKVVWTCVSRVQMVICSGVFVRVCMRVGQGDSKTLGKRERATERERECVFVRDRVTERSEQASACVSE